MRRSHYLNTVEWFNLNTCGDILYKWLGYQVFLVGSCLTTRDFRDVDIRAIFDSENYTGFLSSSTDRRIVSMFISAWLSERTKLTIDFQFQTRDEAEEFKGDRLTLGISI